LRIKCKDIGKSLNVVHQDKMKGRSRCQLRPSFSDTQSSFNIDPIEKMNQSKKI